MEQWYIYIVKDSSTESLLPCDHKIAAAAPGITPTVPTGKGRLKRVCHLSLQESVIQPISPTSACVPRQKRDLNLCRSILGPTLLPTASDYLPSFLDFVGSLDLRDEDV